MSKPIIKIHDMESNEVIEREMTKEEFAQYEANQKQALLEIEEQKAKSIAKANLLNQLGITEEQAKLLLS